MSLLEKIKAGTANRRIVTFPGTDRQIAIRVLSNQDVIDANIAADRVYKDAGIDIGFHNVNDYETEKTVQLLFRACIDPDTGERVASGVSQFRQLTTPEERDRLSDEYHALREECNPGAKDMAPAEFDALVLSLKKKPSETIGSISSLRVLKKLALYLAEEHATLPKGNGPTSS